MSCAFSTDFRVETISVCLAFHTGTSESITVEEVSMSLRISNRWHLGMRKGQLWQWAAKQRAASFPPCAGAVATLAQQAELLCWCGIKLRAAGRCTGVLSSRSLRKLGNELRIGDPRTGRFSADTGAHLRSEHDAWCWAIGVPQVTTERAVLEWDRRAAAPLILEALHAAVSEINSAPGAWRPTNAVESVAYAVRERITPMRRSRSETSGGRSPPCGKLRPPDVGGTWPRGRVPPQSCLPRGAP